MSACPALFISAPASGQGKTTITAGLARYHRRLGRRVRVFKTGPDFLGAIANCDFVTMGDGYTWNTQNRDADIATARKGWNEARRMIESGDSQMVILDELKTVLK